MDAQWLFLFIGAEPQTEWLDGVLARDPSGLRPRRPRSHRRRHERPSGGVSTATPHHLETSVPGVFVAGDVRAESAKRVASAVGEGAMAVMLVHRYLS